MQWPLDMRAMQQPMSMQLGSSCSSSFTPLFTSLLCSHQPTMMAVHLSSYPLSLSAPYPAQQQRFHPVRSRLKGNKTQDPASKSFKPSPLSPSPTLSSSSASSSSSPSSSSPPPQSYSSRPSTPLNPPPPSCSSRDVGPLAAAPSLSPSGLDSLSVSSVSIMGDVISLEPTATEGYTRDEEFDVYRGLVLDCAYRPINVVCWRRALCLDILEKADVLQYYDKRVASARCSFPIPAVLRVSNFVQVPKEKRRRLSLSKNNIFLRDKFKCQYCGVKENLTIDHVKPLSKGGGSSWENLVTACSSCNLKKGDKSLEDSGMRLQKQPKEPRELDSSALPPSYKMYKSLGRNKNTPIEWLDWLPMQQPPLF